MKRIHIFIITCIIGLFGCKKHDISVQPEYIAFVANSTVGDSIMYDPPLNTKTIGWAGGEITLSWNKISGAQKYILEWSTSPKFESSLTKQIDAVSNPYILKGLTNELTYYFRLKYVDGSGTEKDSKATAFAIPSEFIAVENSKFKVQSAMAMRVPLGKKGFNYKPTMIKLPDNSLLAMTFFGEATPQNYIERISSYQSLDGGKNWTDARNIDQIKGREPFLSILSDGVIIVTTHLLDNDMRNKRGHTYSFVYSSYDGGKSWNESEFDEGNVTVLTRNVVELSDKSLILGVSTYGGPSFLYKSFDRGKTWTEKKTISYAGYPANYPFGFFEEGFFRLAANGTINIILRVDSKYLPLDPNQILPNNDQTDRMMVYSSSDGGLTYTFSSNIGTSGEMYPNVLKLKTGELLFTYTVRSLNYPIGLRAIFGTESLSGFTLNFNQNKFILDAKTPPGIVSGGGFGGTIQLDDGTLISCYSYRHTDGNYDSEVIRWKIPD